MRGRTAICSLGMLAIVVQPVRAQERDADVLRPGEVGLSAGAQMWHVDSRFAENGTTSLTPELEIELTPSTLAGFDAIQSLLTSFFDETNDLPDVMPVDAPTLTAGTLSLDAAFSYRYLPIQLGVGVLPRLELDASLPVYRTERLFRDFSLSGGNVGINSDSLANMELLAGITEVGAALGGAPLLPVTGSPPAIELQKRVMALTGDELQLPDSAVTGPELREVFPVLPPSYNLSLWHPGDLEVGARFRILGNFGSAPFPEVGEGGVHYRLTASGAVRFPTGTRPLPDYNIGSPPPAGFGGGRFAAVGDLFLGERVWISSGGSLQILSGADVQVFVPGENGPFSAGSSIATVRRDPGNETNLWILPRFRLAPTISIGATLRTERVSDGSDEFAGVEEPLVGGSLHSAGVFFRYSMLPVPPEQGFKLDATVGFTGAFAGSPGVEAPNTAYFQVTVRRLFGR